MFIFRGGHRVRTFMDICLLTELHLTFLWTEPCPQKQFSSPCSHLCLYPNRLTVKTREQNVWTHLKTTKRLHLSTRGSPTHVGHFLRPERTSSHFWADLASTPFWLDSTHLFRFFPSGSFKQDLVPKKHIPLVFVVVSAGSRGITDDRLHSGGPVSYLWYLWYHAVDHLNLTDMLLTWVLTTWVIASWSHWCWPRIEE